MLKCLDFLRCVLFDIDLDMVLVDDNTDNYDDKTMTLTTLAAFSNVEQSLCVLVGGGGLILNKEQKVSSFRFVF